VLVEQRHWAPWFVVFPGPFPNRDEFETRANENQRTPLWKMLSEVGAVDFRRTKLHLTLRCVATQRIVVSNISVVVVRRDAPLGGDVVGEIPQGVADAMQLMFNLDERGTVIPAREWVVDDRGRPSAPRNEPYFERHSIDLTTGESQLLYVLADATTHDCQWRIRVDVQTGRHRTTVTVDDNGLPFRTSGGAEERLRSAAHWYWTVGGRFWDCNPEASSSNPSSWYLNPDPLPAPPEAP
jgi:hypothetical protein